MDVANHRQEVIGMLLSFPSPHQLKTGLHVDRRIPAAGGGSKSHIPATASTAAERTQQPLAATSGTAAGAEPPSATAAGHAVSTQHVLRMVLNPRVLVFLWQCSLMGFAVGVIGTYEFLYLKELGGPETMIGWALLVSAVAAGVQPGQGLGVKNSNSPH